MLKGVGVALAIMVVGAVSIMVPVVHFILPFMSPFVAGFVGGTVAKADENRIAMFGLMVTALFLPLAVGVGLAALLGSDELFGVNSALVAVLAFVLIPITWFGTTIGALVSYLVRSREKA